MTTRRQLITIELETPIRTSEAEIRQMFQTKSLYPKKITIENLNVKAEQ